MYFQGKQHFNLKKQDETFFFCALVVMYNRVYLKRDETTEKSDDTCEVDRYACVT